MANSTLFICIRLGVFVAMLYFFLVGILLIPSATVYESDSVAAANKSKISNIVLMVVDGLRSDMIASKTYAQNWPNLYAILEERIVMCSTASLTIPTVTGPRIKAMATGSIPQFIELLYNLHGFDVKQSSWVRLMSSNNRRLELYGDNTWLKLFPGAFKRSDGTTSFYVSDYVEVDVNVTRHLDDRLSALSEWDLMILHYLGLDHIGHVLGPRCDTMRMKIQEMDTAIGKIVSTLNSSTDDWLVVLTGDHGMSDQGSHGGGSFSETTTSMLLISPKLKNLRTSGCVIDGNVFSTKSDQTDLATLLGLLTGVGIPAGSIGVPPLRILQAFWSDPLQRYAILLQLLEHLQELNKCTDTSCNYELLVSGETLKLDRLHTEISTTVKLCSVETVQHPICNRMSSEMEELTTQVINLLSAFQRRTLSRTNMKVDFTWAASICLVLATISISFLIPGVRDMLKLDEYFPLKPSHQQRALAYTLLASTSFFGFLAYLLSLTASSLIEEEHQTWYFLTNTNCFVLFFVLALSARKGGSVNNVMSLIFVVCLDRFLLKLLNQTGAKWIHLPDFTDWLEQHSVLLWLAVVSAWIVILLIRLLLSPSMGRIRGIRLCSSLTLAVVAFTQLVYRIAHATEPNAEHSPSRSSMLPARLAFVALALDFGACLRFLCTFATWSIDIGALSPVLSVAPCGAWTVPSPVHSLAFLACLLGPPSGVLLWAGVILKEVLLARIFHAEFAALGASRSRSRSKLLYFIVMLYWFEGWVTYFQQGNSNNFSTVYIAAGYVGLSQHSNVLSTLMVVFYTFAGPLFWQLSLYLRYLLNFGISEGVKESDARRSHMRDCVSFSLGFLSLTTTVSAVVCLFMHAHIFIWSVFAPKFVLMAIYCCVSIPIYVFMLVCRSFFS